MKNKPNPNALGLRKGLPDTLRVLVEQYPRDIWQAHKNFDGTTRFWMERHLMFRDVLGRLRTDTQGFLDTPDDPRGYVQRTARMAGFFLQQLHGHHQIEDAHYFPLLSGLEKRLTAGFELLDADHHALDAHLQALADGTNAALAPLQSGDLQKGRDAAGALEAQLGGFEHFLNRHLLDEEDLVIPVILHHAPRM